MDVFTRIWGKKPDGKTMGQKTKGQTIWSLCLINTAGMQLKSGDGGATFSNSQRKSTYGKRETEYLVNGHSQAKKQAWLFIPNSL